MNNNELRLKKLLYRSIYRGCKETDIIFGKFARKTLHLLSEAELMDYEALLELNDIVIYNWITGTEQPPKEYDTAVLRKMKYEQKT